MKKREYNQPKSQIYKLRTSSNLLGDTSGGNLPVGGQDGNPGGAKRTDWGLSD